MGWMCPKCGSTEYRKEEVAFTGTGLSRLLDFQGYEFIVISCKNCGYSEFYNKSIVGNERELMKIMDLLFSR